MIELPHEGPPDGTALLVVPQAPGPSPVDVLHALERRAPLIVQGSQGVFHIDADGAVSLLPESDPRVQAIRAAQP